ncbi:histidinol-phosphatase [Alkalibacter mobilis]|uniref:histidinol-phosphatase n=1 Tax=Alkalibacter mobilis TaxID=2787712 RepID=UPI00189F2463|nr:histidinol-phosphatase [Alkalibacter mobilis]MBF7096563.1 histidinol-phosphatase [Alkalibacter mobilis]
MIKSNFHIHSEFCDGKNTIEDMVLAAIDHELESIGITSHAPIEGESHWTMSVGDLDKYFEEIDRLKNKYSSSIEIYTSMEIDYFFDKGLNPSMKYYMNRLDYYIGSVHALGSGRNGKYWYLDEDPESFVSGINETFHGDARKAVEYYYDILSNMVLECNPDIVGHMDIIKKNNPGGKIFNERESWYKSAVDKFLDVVKTKDSIIEINTGGVRRFGLECFYPSHWILDMIRDKKIKVTVNGDSHDVGGVNYYYAETAEILKSKGINEISVFKDGEWKNSKF